MATNKEPDEDNLKSQQQLLDMYENNMNVGDNKDEDNKSFEEEEEYSMVEKFEMEGNEKSLNMEKEESDIEVLPSMVAHKNENSKSSENEDEAENSSIQNYVENNAQVPEKDQDHLVIKEVKEDEDVKNKKENDFSKNEPENGELQAIRKKLSELEQRQEKRKHNGFNFKIAALICVMTISITIFYSILSPKPSNDKVLSTKVDKLMNELKRSQQDMEHLEKSLSVEIDKHEKVLHETQLKIERQNMFLDQENSVREKDPNKRDKNIQERINNQMATQALQIALLELDEKFQNHKENVKIEIETAMELELKRYESKYNEQNGEKVSQKFQTEINEFNKIIETWEIKFEEKIKKAIEKEIHPTVNKIEPHHKGRENKEKEINEQINKRLIGFCTQVGIAIFVVFLFAMASIKRIIENKIKTEVEAIERKETSKGTEKHIKNESENNIETQSSEHDDEFQILHKKICQLQKALYSTLPVQLQLSSSKVDGPSGFYSRTSEQENEFPVYKKVTGDDALFLSVDTQGFWGVKTELGSCSPVVRNQENNPTPIIPPEYGWKYCPNNEETTSLIVTHVPDQLSIDELSESEEEVDSKLKVTPVPVQLLINSSGPSQTTRCDLMGVYRLTHEQVNHHPVYKRIAAPESAQHSGNQCRLSSDMAEAFLYMSASMKWSVGYEVGSATCYLRSVQYGICPPSNDWEYSDGKWIKDPCLTVKVPTSESRKTVPGSRIADDRDKKIDSSESVMEEELDHMED